MVQEAGLRDQVQVAGEFYCYENVKDGGRLGFNKHNMYTIVQTQKMINFGSKNADLLMGQNLLKFAGFDTQWCNNGISKCESLLSLPITDKQKTELEEIKSTITARLPIAEAIENMSEEVSFNDWNDSG